MSKVFFEQLIRQPKLLFLIDSAGGFLTALLVGIVLVRLEHLIGMPPRTLYILAVLGIVCGLYSLLCGLLLKRHFQPFLKGIAIANSLYCVLSLVFVLWHFKEVTALGLLYFALEILIIGKVIHLEVKAQSIARLPGSSLPL